MDCGVGISLAHLRIAPARSLLMRFSSLGVAVRRQPSAAQGSTCGPGDPSVAGRHYGAEESHAHSRGTALHRLRTRGCEAVDEQELAVRETPVMSPVGTKLPIPNVRFPAALGI
jgi:hypothetical protein